MMSDRVSETDKMEFFENCLGWSRSTRNIISYGLLGSSSIVGLALTAYKITNPSVMIGCVVLNGLAYFIKCSKHDYKMQIRERDDIIRRMSTMNAETTDVQEMEQTVSTNPLSVSALGRSTISFGSVRIEPNELDESKEKRLGEN